MNIDFGIVKKYFSDRGFGFVTHTFLADGQPEVFFHIKSIKRTRPDLAENLGNLGNEEPIDATYFWYETEYTSKGEQVCNALESDVIHNMVTDNLRSYVDKIESIWSDIDSTIPVWLRDVTVDLVGVEQASELSLERDTLEKERIEEEKRRKEREALQKIEEEKRRKEREALQKIEEEKRRKEREALQKIEEGKRQKLIEEQNIQEKIEQEEFKQLVAEMKPLGFTHSNQVSWYIMNNRLGYKYKNISGIVKMEKDGTSWNFKGGFPPMIYARLCEELELSNQKTRARAVGFKPFKDL